MIKILSLIVLSSLYLFGAGFWTLSGITKANIFIQNEVPSLKSQTLKSVKEKMAQMLTNNGIKTQQQDAPTLMIGLEEIHTKNTHYVYTKLILGEEVQTFRKDKSATFAFTYFSNDFIEVDKEELDSEVLESVDFLLSQFSEHYEDDKE